MNRMVWLSAAAVAVVVAGCRTGEGESPSLDRKESANFNGVPGLPRIGDRSDSGPMAVAGDPVAAPIPPNPSAGPGASSPPLAGPAHVPAAAPPSRAIVYEPAMPKTDREVKGSYQGPDGVSVSVAAVCKITEDSVQCWKTDGKRDKNLESKLDQMLQAQQGMYSPGLTFKYKRKNRMILFSIHQPTSANGRRAIVSISQVGSDMGYGYVSVGNLRELAPNQPDTNYEIRAVSVPFDQKTVDAIVNTTKPKPFPELISLSGGSKISSDGNSIAYASCKQSDGGMYGPGSKGWDVTLRVSKKDPRLNFSFSPVVKDEYAGYMSVNQNGDMLKPGSDSRTEANMAGGPRFFSASVMAMPVAYSAKEVKLRLNVNPKYIKGLRVNLMQTETTKLKGIRLDY